MRVIAGKFGSRPLKSMRGFAVRPTSDRLRETLFNILGPAVEGSVFVDVYAGTGAVGIEALSRGASEAFFIENHSAAVKLIRENLRSLGLEPAAVPFPASRGLTVVPPASPPASADLPRVEILAADAREALEKLQARRFVADFFYVDPPYAEVEEYFEILETFAGGRMLARSGSVIFESLPRKIRGWDFPDRIGDLEKTRIVEQGDAVLSFYRLARAA